jgi:iron complex outermembrane receptor protein
VEHNDYMGLEFEPSVRLQWQAREDSTLWGAVSRAVRTPSRIDREMFQPAPGFFPILYGSDEFQSEKVLAYELGYRARLGEPVLLSVATYYNEYTDLRSTGLTPVNVFPLVFRNELQGHTYGIELTVGWQLTPNWRLRGGYNLLEERLETRPGGFDFSEGRNETSDPEQQASLRSSITLPWRMELDAGLRWVDSLENNDGPTRGTVPHYLELEARIAWHASNRLELSVTGQNLLHGRHPEYGFPRATRAEAQRSIFGKVTWRY